MTSLAEQISADMHAGKFQTRQRPDPPEHPATLTLSMLGDLSRQTVVLLNGVATCVTAVAVLCDFERGVQSVKVTLPVRCAGHLEVANIPDDAYLITVACYEGRWVLEGWLTKTQAIDRIKRRGPV